MNYVLEILPRLMNVPSPSGFTGMAAEFVMNELKEMGYDPSLTRKGCVLVCLGGEGDPLILTSHIDTLGAMVAEIKQNGRLRIVPIGGLSPNNTETEDFTLYTRFGNKKFTGNLQLKNASVHVNGDYHSEKRTYESMELLLDENTSSKEETEALGISVGDYVCANPRYNETPSGYIKSRFLDDKLSAAILLGLAKRIRDENIKPARKIYLYFTVYEEVGHGCSAGLPEDAEEILSVDMGCVGDSVTCSEKQVSICAKDSRGPSDYEVTTKLIACAKGHGINYSVDVYPYYSSDADFAILAGYDLKHCVVGSGVYASHGYERTHTEGIKNTLELLYHYINE